MTSKDNFIKDKVYEFGVRFGIKIADEQDLNAMLMAVYVQGVNDSKQFIVLPPAVAYEVQEMADIKNIK